MQVFEQSIRTKAVKTFNLMPFGDLQVGSPLFSPEGWKRYVEDLKKTENAVTIGMGDYTDHFRPTVQDWLKGSLHKDHEAMGTVDDMHWDHVMKHIVPLLRPVIKYSKCLGLLGGHHDFTYQDGTTSTQRICRELGIPYLGTGETMIRLKLIVDNSTLSLVLWASHGEGAGSGISGAVNALKKMLGSFPGVDIFLRGHSCDTFVLVEPVYELTNSSPPRLRGRNRIIANTGGFSESRVEGHTTYVEKRNLMPKAIGWVKIPLTIMRDKTTVRYLHLGGNQS